MPAGYEKAFTALADPTRRLIFEKLSRGASAVVDIARNLPVTRPAVSQHLKVLVAARLVKSSRDGTRHIYDIDQGGLTAMREYLDRFWSGALSAFKDAAESEEKKRRRGRYDS